jgi:hypothetical protein
MPCHQPFGCSDCTGTCDGFRSEGGSQHPPDAFKEFVAGKRSLEGLPRHFGLTSGRYSENKMIGRDSNGGYTVAASGTLSRSRLFVSSTRRTLSAEVYGDRKWMRTFPRRPVPVDVS